MNFYYLCLGLHLKHAFLHIDEHCQNKSEPEKRKKKMEKKRDKSGEREREMYNRKLPLANNIIVLMNGWRLNFNDSTNKNINFSIIRNLIILWFWLDFKQNGNIVWRNVYLSNLDIHMCFFSVRLDIQIEKHEWNESMWF